MTKGFTLTLENSFKSCLKYLSEFQIEEEQGTSGRGS